MNILNLPFSFVQFASISQTDYILPVFSEGDVWFSLIVRGSTTAEASAIYAAADTEMQLLLLRGYDNVPASVPSQTLRNYTIEDGLKFRKYRVTNTDVLFVWTNDLKRIVTNTPFISCRECFQLGILFMGQIRVSNPFRKICDNVDTTFIQYYSYDNAFQFYYCNTGDFQNRIRIPALLYRPQMATDQNIYVRSNGTRKLTKSVKSKEFNMLIDYATISLHEKIDMALSHDVVYVDNRNYKGSVVALGSYDIDWEGALNKFSAQAECKLVTTPFYAKNSNCDTCGPACDVIIDNLQISKTGNAYTVSWSVISGTATSFLVSINGEQNQNTTANSFTFNGLGIGSHFVVVTPVCVAGNGSPKTTVIAILPEATQPGPCVYGTIKSGGTPTGAVANQVYNHKIYLNGTPPFTLSNITKPDWMTITTVSYSGQGAYVSISGTPPVTGSFPVSFRVNNCTVDYFTFSNNVVVVGEGCTAQVSTPVASAYGNGVSVAWTVTSGSPSGFRVGVPGMAIVVTSSPATFGYVPVGSNTITVTPICGFVDGTTKSTTFVKNAECDMPSATISTLPNAIVGVAYNVEYNIGGTAPFTVEIVEKPSWLTIAISGSKVVLSGTPTATASNVNVKFKIKNCHTEEPYYQKTITTVEDQECNPVALAGSFAPPNALVGVSYTYSIGLMGTAPFNITNVVKPSWMTVSLTGSTVTLSGTPTATHAGTSTGFRITNCTSEYIDMSGFIAAVEDNFTPISLAGNTTMPNGMVNTAYSHQMSVVGSTPYSIQVLDKPSWMNISMPSGGNSIYFTGTPIALAGNQTVWFRVFNDASEAYFNQEIDVTADGGPCISVSKAYEPPVPEMQVGVAFTYTVVLAGSLPFDMITYSVPSWMTATLSGNELTLSGTPTSTGSGYIYIVLLNCGATTSGPSINIPFTIS